MQRLILLRHGKAEAASASGADIDRALTDRGRRDAELMARLLAQADLTPGLALVSDARRTRETWDRLAPTFPSARVQYDHALYLATAEHIAHIAALNAQPDGCLIVVGHNPGLHDLALSYASCDRSPAQERLLDGFPTSTAATFALAANGRWRLELVLTPRDAEGDLA